MSSARPGAGRLGVGGQRDAGRGRGRRRHRGARQRAVETGSYAWPLPVVTLAAGVDRGGASASGRAQAVASQLVDREQCRRLELVGRARAVDRAPGDVRQGRRRRGRARSRASSYSSSRPGPNSSGSSALRLQRTPAASSAGSGCSAIDGYDRQQQVRRGAHVEADVGVGQARHQLRVLDRPHAVLDAVGAEGVERAPAPTPGPPARRRGASTAARPRGRWRTPRRTARAGRPPRRWRGRTTRRPGRRAFAAMPGLVDRDRRVDGAVGGDHQADADVELRRRRRQRRRGPCRRSPRRRRSGRGGAARRTTARPTPRRPSTQSSTTSYTRRAKSSGVSSTWHAAT